MTKKWMKVTGEYGLQVDSEIQKTGERMRPEEGPDTFGPRKGKVYE